MPEVIGSYVVQLASQRSLCDAQALRSLLSLMLTGSQGPELAKSLAHW